MAMHNRAMKVGSVSGLHDFAPSVYGHITRCEQRIADLHGASWSIYRLHRCLVSREERAS